MERKISNAQLVKLLRERVSSNSWEPNKEPKKIFGITVKPTPKSFVREGHRHWREYGIYYLEATPELHVVEVTNVLDLKLIKEKKEIKSTSIIETLDHVVDHTATVAAAFMLSRQVSGQPSKDDKGPNARLYFVNEGDEPKRIIIKLSISKTFNLFRGKAVLYTGNQAVELLCIHDEKITYEGDEICFFEVKQEDFVKFLNDSNSLIELEGNGNWQVLQLMSQEEEEEDLKDRIERKVRDEEWKAKKAKEEKKSYSKKSTSQLKQEAIDEMNKDYERRWEQHLSRNSNGKSEMVERMWYYHWVHSDGPFSCQDKEHKNYAVGLYSVRHTGWRAAYDLNLNTNHWPQDMQNYMRALERMEAVEAKFKKWKESVVGFFKKLFGKK